MFKPVVACHDPFSALETACRRTLETPLLDSALNTLCPETTLSRQLVFLHACLCRWRRSRPKEEAVYCRRRDVAMRVDGMTNADIKNEV